MATNLFIQRRKGEGFDKMLKRFRRKAGKMKIIELYKDSLVYEKPSDRKRKERKAARYKAH